MPGKLFWNFVDRETRSYRITAMIAGIAILGGALIILVGAATGSSIGDLRSRAWSGVTYNAQKLQELVGRVPEGKKLDPSPVTETAVADDRTSRGLFHKLSRTYWNAEVQNIDIPEAGVTGVAFLAYDQDLGKTFIFSRIAGLPAVPGTIVQLWIAKDITTLQQVGIGEFFAESGGPVLYSVVSRPGDLRTWDELLVSYDSALTLEQPESVVIRLKF